MSRSPAVILYDASGNPLAVADGVTIPAGTKGLLIAGSDGVNARFAKVTAAGRVVTDGSEVTQPISASTLPLPTGAATEVTLASIKDSDGIKKITDALPAGTNRIGAVRLLSQGDVALDVVPNTTLPANTRGLVISGSDTTGKAQFAQVDVDAVDGVRRLQITGKVTTSYPTAPPSTTPVTIDASTPLSITTTSTTEYTISNGKTFVIQQVSTGAEGDPTEKGSKIEIIYYDGTTEHLIERIYITGFTQFGVYPDTRTARDGTVMAGDGSTKKIRVKRYRLSGSAQEVDAVVRGYEF